MRHARMLLPLSAAAILIAFAAPAFAQAEGPFWHVGGEKLEAAEEFTANGNLKFRKYVGEGEGFVEVGCGFASKGTLENGAEAGEGELESVLFFAPTCTTNMPNCNLTSYTFNIPNSMVAGEGEVDLLDFAVSAGFSQGCQAFGIPSSISWGGTLRGQWNNESGCLEYAEAGELLLTVTAEPVYTNGELCLTAPGGAITLE